MDWELGRTLGLAFMVAVSGCAGVPQNDHPDQVRGLDGQSTKPNSGAVQESATAGWNRVALRPPFYKTLMVGARFPLGSQNPEEGLEFKASFVHGIDDEGRGWTCPGIIDPVSGKAMTVTDFEEYIGLDAARRLPTLDGFDCDPDKAGGPAPGQP